MGYINDDSMVRVIFLNLAGSGIALKLLSGQVDIKMFSFLMLLRRVYKIILKIDQADLKA